MMLGARISALLLLGATSALAQDQRKPATTLDDIGPAFRACWVPPPEIGSVKADVTVRFALRADGTLLGEPRATAAAGLPEGPARTLLIASAVGAIRKCTPLAMSPGLGRAIAGRVFTLRFLHSGAVEQGVSNRV